MHFGKFAAFKAFLNLRYSRLEQKVSAFLVLRDLLNVFSVKTDLSIQFQSFILLRLGLFRFGFTQINSSGS